jgi:xanthine/CO dehydrogenase XdhC/CoxF family maturation factor
MAPLPCESNCITGAPKRDVDMNWGFFEGLGMLVFTLVVGGICFDLAEKRQNRRHNLAVRRHREAAQPPTPSPGPLPSPGELEVYLERMEPVRRALSRMNDQERDYWHRKAHVAIKEIQAIDDWLQAVSTWAPHQREAVEQSAQDKVQTRQRLIMDFARGVLQASAPSPSDANKPAGEN